MQKERKQMTKQNSLIAGYAKSTAIKYSTGLNVVTVQVKASSTYYIRWVWSRVRSLQVLSSTISNWREIEAFKTQSSISPSLYLSIWFCLYLLLCLILIPCLSVCIARLCWGQKQSCGFEGFEPSSLPGKLPWACWAFNEVHNDLCCLMYRK